jgi:hypothetical protein
VTSKFYIGSTTLALAQRLKKHRTASTELRKQASPLYTHFREVGWESAEMYVVSEVDVDSRRALLELERAEILAHLGSPLCLNHNRPIITPAEKKDHDAVYGKLRRATTAQADRERVAEWRRNNPEKRAEQVRRSLDQQRQKRAQMKNVAE